MPKIPSMTNKKILEILRKEKPYLQEKFGLLSIGLFGSYAKGTESPESDIDVLVELTEPRFDFPSEILLSIAFLCLRIFSNL